MDKLWAPWRAKYIEGKKAKKCIFCVSAKGGGSFRVIRSTHSAAMLNTFPYNNGHLLVFPARHIRELAQLDDKETLDLIRTLNKAKKLLDKVLKPAGFNIGINIARAGGAGITGHLHIHIVPRWVGDTNFMPALAGTKIISQSLKELHKRLKDAQSNSA